MPADPTVDRTVSPSDNTGELPPGQAAPVPPDKGQRKRGSRKTPHGPRPNGGAIEPPQSFLPLVLTMACLIAVALLAFMAIVFVADAMQPTPTAFFLIQLVYALLCGVAGAVVGGSAVVRSALNISGSPVKATVGGGAAMIVVGFLLAFVAAPKLEQPMYSVDIHDVPFSQEVNGERYYINLVGYPPLRALNTVETSKGRRFAVKIPTEHSSYQADIQIHANGKEVWRCELTFATLQRPRKGKVIELFAEREQPHFNLYFTDNYIQRVVSAAAKKKSYAAKNACLEGALTDDRNTSVGFDGTFLVQPQNVYDRFGRRVGVRLGPSHMVKAFEVAAYEAGEAERDVSPGDAVKSPAPPAPSPVVPPGLVVAGPAPNSVARPPAASPAASTGNPPPSAATASITAPAAPPAPQPASNGPASGSSSTAPPVIAPPAASASGPAASTGPQSRPETAGTPTPSPSQKELLALVDRYARGDEFDRGPLYAGWSKVQDYVVEGLRKEQAKRPPYAARYLHLISNALNEIDDQRFVPPLRNPSFGGKVKPERLYASNNIPGFDESDYALVVDLLDHPDENLRKAAQRLLRLFPSNRFYKPIQDYLKKASVSDEQLSFMTEAAAFYFYNRIVELQGAFPLDDRSRKWIEGNYDNGYAWVERAAARDPDHRIFKAMLDYARGSVLWDWNRREDEGLGSYRKMLDTIRSLNITYPVNPQHIATALAVTNGFPSTKVPGSARPYAPDDERKLSGRDFINTGNLIRFFALPETPSKELGKAPLDASGRMILRAETWDLVQVGRILGWIERQPPKTATNRSR